MDTVGARLLDPGHLRWVACGSNGLVRSQLTVSSRAALQFAPKSASKVNRVSHGFIAATAYSIFTEMRLLMTGPGSLIYLIVYFM